jgi:hypothetical protein
MSDGCPPEVLLDMQSLTELLPAYDRVFGATRLWELETILDWAERTGRADKIDQQVLARIVGGCD